MIKFDDLRRENNGFSDNKQIIPPDSKELIILSFKAQRSLSSF